MNLPTNFHLPRSVGILMVVGFVVLAAIGYFIMGGKSDEGTVSVTAGPATESEATFVTLAGELDSIVFSTEILSDLRFTAREDIHTAIIPENVGRTDPFAPLGR